LFIYLLPFDWCSCQLVLCDACYWLDTEELIDIGRATIWVHICSVWPFIWVYTWVEGSISSLLCNIECCGRWITDHWILITFRSNNLLFTYYNIQCYVFRSNYLLSISHSIWCVTGFLACIWTLLLFFPSSRVLIILFWLYLLELVYIIQSWIELVDMKNKRSYCQSTIWNIICNMVGEYAALFLIFLIWIWRLCIQGLSLIFLTLKSWI